MCGTLAEVLARIGLMHLVDTWLTAGLTLGRQAPTSDNTGLEVYGPRFTTGVCSVFSLYVVV